MKGPGPIRKRSDRGVFHGYSSQVWARPGPGAGAPSCCPLRVAGARVCGRRPPAGAAPAVTGLDWEEPRLEPGSQMWAAASQVAVKPAVAMPARSGVLRGALMRALRLVCSLLVRSQKQADFLRACFGPNTSCSTLWLIFECVYYT